MKHIKYIKYIKYRDTKITVYMGQPYYEAGGKWYPFVFLKGKAEIFPKNLPWFFDIASIQKELTHKDPNHFVKVEKVNLLSITDIPPLNISPTEELVEDLALGITNPDKVNDWLIGQGAEVAKNLLQPPKELNLNVKNALFIFDFDLTLTWRHTYFDFPQMGQPSPEETAKNIKPHVAAAFRAIWESGNEIAIATNSQYPDVVKAHLQAAGLSDEEIARITLKTRVFGIRKVSNIVDIIKENFEKGIASVYLYDDEGDDKEDQKGYFKKVKEELQKHPKIHNRLQLHTLNVETKKYETLNNRKQEVKREYSFQIDFFINEEKLLSRPKIAPRNKQYKDEDCSNIDAQNFSPYHPNLPTTEQAQNKYNVASDHAPVLISIPTDEAEIKIISYNVLSEDEASGFAPSGKNKTNYGENSVNRENRLEQIANDLIRYIKANQPQFIALQEIRASERNLLYIKIQTKLNELRGEDKPLNYACVKIGDEVVDGKGNITLYNVNQFDPITENVTEAKALELKQLQFRGNKTLFKSKTNPKLKIRIANTHHLFGFTPENHERNINEFLSENEKNTSNEDVLSIVVGDFNCTVAPLDNKPQNNTTNVSIPATTNGIQVGYAIDGAFYSYRKAGSNKVDKFQASSCQLDSSNGKMIKEGIAPIDVSSLTDRQRKVVTALRMMICVDASHHENKIINEQYTIFEYEDNLRSKFSSISGSSILVRRASDLNNHKGIGISLPKALYDYLKLNNSSLQFRVEWDLDKRNARYFVFAHDENIKSLTQTLEKIENAQTIDSMRKDNKSLLELSDAIDLLEKDHYVDEAVIKSLEDLFSAILNQHSNLDYSKLAETFKNLALFFSEQPLYKYTYADLGKIEGELLKLSNIENNFQEISKKIENAKSQCARIIKKSKRLINLASRINLLEENGVEEALILSFKKFYLQMFDKDVCLDSNSHDSNVLDSIELLASQFAKYPDFQFPKDIIHLIETNIDQLGKKSKNQKISLAQEQLFKDLKLVVNKIIRFTPFKKDFKKLQTHPEPANSINNLKVNNFSLNQDILDDFTYLYSLIFNGSCHNDHESCIITYLNSLAIQLQDPLLDEFEKTYTKHTRKFKIELAKSGSTEEIKHAMDAIEIILANIELLKNLRESESNARLIPTSILNPIREKSDAIDKFVTYLQKLNLPSKDAQEAYQATQHILTSIQKDSSEQFHNPLLRIQAYLEPIEKLRENLHKTELPPEIKRRIDNIQKFIEAMIEKKKNDAMVSLLATIQSLKKLAKEPESPNTNNPITLFLNCFENFYKVVLLEPVDIKDKNSAESIALECIKNMANDINKHGALNLKQIAKYENTLRLNLYGKRPMNPALKTALVTIFAVLLGFTLGLLVGATLGGVNAFSGALIGAVTGFTLATEIGLGAAGATGLLAARLTFFSSARKQKVYDDKLDNININEKVNDAASEVFATLSANAAS